MKILLCGLGSIGERHVNNLLSLGYTDFLAYRTRQTPLRTVTIPIPTVSSISEAIKQKPDVAFITNPSIYHTEMAITLAKHGIHLFIEKPLATTMKDISKLAKIIEQKKIVVEIGFMLRYHPAVIQIKQWLQDQRIGDPCSIHTFWGEYLPDWHPWENYRSGYAARTDLGGGPVNTLCHDLDLVSYFFGMPKRVYAVASRSSSLEIQCDHSVDITLEWKERIATVHLDYISQPPKRGWTIIGDLGRIEWDYYQNSLIAYAKGEIIEKHIFQNFERNDMFLEEVKDFLHAVKNRSVPAIPLSQGIQNVQLISTINHSIIKHKPYDIHKFF